MSQLLQLDDLVDGQRFDRFNINLLAWSFLAMMADGYDLAGLASAAPELARSWHIAPAQFAPALSASLFGILIGAPLLGYVGDRSGRKTAIIVGCVLYGLGTLATVWATSLQQVALLRVVTGIGLGGLLPNAVALNSEMAPRRLRAMLVVLMFTGISAGAAIPGAVQAWLIPTYGWPIMFWIGGLGPLVIAACLVYTLPESVKYLALRPSRHAALLTTLRKLRRDLTIVDDTRIHFVPAPPTSGSGLVEIFNGQLAWITPLLWTCFAAALMANFFLNSWLPLILEQDGFTAKEAGLAISCYHYGGMLGGLLVSVLLGRLGFAAVAALFLFAAMTIPLIGTSGLSYWTLVLTVSLSGLCTVGAQFGNNALSGLLYPTTIRSRGVGWALGVGRLGSIAGPVVGGMLLGRHIPMQQLFVVAAAPMVAGLTASAVAARLCQKRLGTICPDITSNVRQMRSSIQIGSG